VGQPVGIDLVKDEPAKVCPDEAGRRIFRFPGDSAMSRSIHGTTLLLIAVLAVGLFAGPAAAEVKSRVEGQTLIAQEPKDPASYINFSRFLVKIGDLEEAQEVLETGRNKANKSANLMVELAVVYEERGRLSKAESAAHEAVALDPGNSDAHLRLGEIQFRMGHKKAGVASYRRAQELEPEEALPRVRLANGLMDVGEAAEAEDLCLQFISTDPDNPDLWLALGRSFEKQGKNREAFTTYGQVLSLDPTEAEAYARRGRLFCRFSQFDSAEESCRKALELDPDNMLAHAYLGIACSYLDKGKDARKHASIAEAGGMNMGAVWDKLGK
jgi:tetratricopeptide (TPR) repeat protein